MDQPCVYMKRDEGSGEPLVRESPLVSGKRKRCSKHSVLLLPHARDAKARMVSLC